MADVRDLFYHGVRHQIKRVFTALGRKRVEMGLIAWEEGAIGDWGSCFFYHALKDDFLTNHIGNPEARIAEHLGFGHNRVPVRIVYTLFDDVGRNRTINRMQLKDMLRSFIDETRDPEMTKAMDDVLRNVNFTKAETEDKLEWQPVCALDEHK